MLIKVKTTISNSPMTPCLAEQYADLCFEPTWPCALGIRKNYVLNNILSDSLWAIFCYFFSIPPRCDIYNASPVIFLHFAECLPDGIKIWHEAHLNYSLETFDREFLNRSRELEIVKIKEFTFKLLTLKWMNLSTFPEFQHYSRRYQYIYRKFSPMMLSYLWKGSEIFIWLLK